MTAHDWSIALTLLGIAVQAGAMIYALRNSVARLDKMEATLSAHGERLARIEGKEEARG